MADATLPSPPTPAEADLQDFPFMPLQVARLRDSDLAAEEHPEACWYAVLLWGAAWHQIPAGSLPDNDVVLMRLVGLGRDHRTWKKHRDGALRGFVLCSDGRLYHPVVAEQVAEGWNGKLRQRHRTYCAAIRKHNERHPNEKRDLPDFDQWIALSRPDRVVRDNTGVSHSTPPIVACDIGSKGERQGQGQGQGDSKEEGEAKASSSSAGPNDRPVLVLISGQEPDQPDLPELPPAAKLEPEHIAEAWNAMAARTGLPPVVKLSAERRKAAKARIAEYRIEDFTEAIAAIERSDFLRNGSGTWRGANFDFLLQKSSFLKLIEGQYDQKPAAR